MRPKKGTVLPEMGTVLHPADGDTGLTYAEAVAAALRQQLGATHQGIKLAMRWTGASERTVKYWFAGNMGPSGKHLIALARHSDVVLAMILRQAGRHEYAIAFPLVDARETFKEIFQTLQSILEDADGQTGVDNGT